MKVNKTSWEKKEPTLYKQEELKTYETAYYNKPYIAGVFTKAQLLNVDEFNLGDNVTYIMPSDSVRKRRSVVVYRNGPLTPGETYVVFQRLQVQVHIKFKKLALWLILAMFFSVKSIKCGQLGLKIHDNKKC
ncbi:uncharacterized protein LOC130653909 [Hydractinia symbiolongicarpus]|uniref:uncharacterized protein LOC130653909 n=1 Tax=Hydractinia symbiolongicarpus TaxID=13093 RepID=UPI00255059E2|nr:uncharacterized protein LOC130653909 [Hydractinia symbiolongicarpus]